MCTFTPEIITLIIGTVLGTILAFGFNQLEKWIEKKGEKKKAMMCLKIELRRIKLFIDALVRTQSNLGPSIPSADIPELDMATQAPQFMFFEEVLAENIYDLSTCLINANKYRQLASELFNNQLNPTFHANAEIFVHELEHAQQVLNEINKVIDFKKDLETNNKRL